MTRAKKAEAGLDIPKLKKLLGKATQGPWRIDTSLFGKYLNITAQEREGFLDRKDGDGPICHLPTERHHYRNDKDPLGRPLGESRSWDTPIKKARADADLIVAAVNMLPELIRRFGMDIGETAWLIEWPADKYGPVRYWSAADPMPVISVDDATRFARQQDAEAVIRSKQFTGCEPSEHMWMAPKEEAQAA